MNKQFRRKPFPETPTEPPATVWHKAMSKHAEERQPARDTLSLLIVLLEDALAIRADSSEDPLEDLDLLLREPPAGKPVDSVERPYVTYVPKKAVKQEAS